MQMNRERQMSLSDFFQMEYQRLVDYVRRRIRDSAQRSGEDIVQEVMLNILERPDVMAPISDLTSYVFRALRNRIIDLYRSPKQEELSMDMEDSNGLSLFDVLPDEKYQPENAFHRRSLRKLVFRLIRELPRAQMEVIVETEFGGKTFRELSEKWNVPVGTLLARKHRGVKTVREKLAGMEVRR